MAFGKDMSQLGRIPAFGGTSMQQRTGFTQRHGQAPRTSRSRRFSDEYKPPLDSVDTGRLILGDYAVRVPVDDAGSLIEVHLEYFPFVEHYDGRTKRSAVCSGGPLHNFKGKREDCRGCDIFYNPGTEKKRMSKRDMFAFSFLHMVPYHKTESIDQSNGQVRMNTQTNQPYYDWVPCKGRVCEYCRVGKEMVQGRVRPWPMGWSHFNALINLFGKNIARSCTGCGGRDTITSLAWVCPVEGCGDAIIDMSTTTLNDKDIDKVVTNDTVCPYCKNTVFVREIFACASCQAARRSTVFDVNIQVQRFASGKDPDSNQTQLVVAGYSNPCVVDPTYNEVAKPLPLDRMFGPTSIEIQDKLFEVQGGAPVQNQGFRPYGQQGQPPQGQPQGQMQQPQYQQQAPQGSGFGLPQPQVQFAPQPQYQPPQQANPTFGAPQQGFTGFPAPQGPNYSR